MPQVSMIGVFGSIEIEPHQMDFVLLHFDEDLVLTNTTQLFYPELEFTS